MMQKKYFIRPPILWSFPLVLQSIVLFAYLPSTGLLAGIPDWLLEYLEWLPGIFLIIGFAFLIGFSLITSAVFGTESPSVLAVSGTILICSVLWVVLVNLYYFKFAYQKRSQLQEAKLLWQHLVLWGLINIILTIWLWKGTIDL